MLPWVLCRTGRVCRLTDEFSLCAEKLPFTSYKALFFMEIVVEYLNIFQKTTSSQSKQFLLNDKSML